jgi:hypothetical protein
MTSTLNLTKSSLSGVTSPAGDTLTELNNAETTALLEINETGSVVSNYTGSCLSSVSKALGSVTRDSGGTVGNILGSISSADPDVTAMLGALSKVSGLQGLVTTLKIPPLITKLDELMTCVESAGCVDVGTMQNYLDQVDSFLSDMSLSDAGELDTTSMMTTVGLDTEIQDSVASGIEKVTSMKETIGSAASGLSGGSSIWNKVKNLSARF